MHFRAPALLLNRFYGLPGDEIGIARRLRTWRL